MTQAEFDARFRVTPATHPNLSSDTLLRLNREVFAQVADLDAAAPDTARAVKDAFIIAIQDL